MIKSEMQVRKRTKTADLTLLAMFTAIIVIMAFTPIGMIQLPVIKATILHVPVIIGSILLGPARGAYFGGLFGLVSLIKNTTAPTALSFAFSPFISVPGTGHGSIWAIVICFAPRILVGITPWLFYAGMTKLLPNAKVGLKAVFGAISGVIGAFTNTALVMGLIYILFKDAYAVLKDIPAAEVRNVILGVIVANGIPEAICAAIIVPAVAIPLMRIVNRNR